MSILEKFIQMKIEQAEKVIDELKNSTANCCSDYDLGSRDGYLEAAELELQTLKQILGKSKNENEPKDSFNNISNSTISL